MRENNKRKHDESFVLLTFLSKMYFPGGFDSNFSIKMLVNNTKYTTYCGYCGYFETFKRYIFNIMKLGIINIKKTPTYIN